VRRLWIASAAALLTACGAESPTVNCSPCAGPGFTATGMPQNIDHGNLRICVGQEPCTRRRLSGPLSPRSEQFVELADGGPSWEQYDGTPVTVTVTSGSERWQGSGDFSYADGGDGTCACSSLVADVVLQSVSRRG
jgi:hypothetical protein